MNKYRGAIIAHIGPMFGGKSSALIEFAKKFTRAKYKVVLFKFIKDDRYSGEESYICTHDGIKYPAVNIRYIEEIIDIINTIEDLNVVAIDELQFLESSTGLDSSAMVQLLLDTVFKLNKTLMFSGLTLDSELKSFDIVKEILPYATHLNQYKAVCVNCGDDATTSFCKVQKTTQELVGGDDIYEPRCIKCFNDDKR